MDFTCQRRCTCAFTTINHWEYSLYDNTEELNWLLQDMMKQEDRSFANKGNTYLDLEKRQLTS